MSASDLGKGKPEWTDDDRSDFELVANDIAFCVAIGVDVSAEDLAKYRRLHRKRSLWVGREPLFEEGGSEV